MNYQELPVYQQKEQIINGLAKSPVIIVESPTGSGKTTQIPVILHEAGYSRDGIIGITQPRRIAALSVSEFVSLQMKTTVGSLVGYKMRFEDKTSFETLIKIMTDGILLQELKTDPILSKYSVLMVDEAHERSLNIDFILGLLKQILKQRPEFKVIISSATINSAIFSEYFDNCPIIKIKTPIYPIELHYAPLPPRSVPEILYKQITDIVSHYVSDKEKNPDKTKGDVLIFLQGERNIKECTQALLESSLRNKVWILQLYGRLSKEEQEKVFLPTPPGKTKVVISTNIAETSVTIDKITLVIDSGLAKINFYSPFTFTSSLVEQNISQASANQRKGRSGRTGPGICYRLYSAEDFNKRPDFTIEEIYRTDLSEVVLRMSDLGISDFENFDYISPPTKEGIIGAVQTLELLDAIDSNRHLTEIGKRMVYFPLSPRHARMIVEAIINYPTVLNEVLIASAFLSTNSPFLLPQGEEIEARLAHHNFRDQFGDFVSYLKIFKRFTQAKKGEEFCKSYYLDFKTLTEIVNIKQQLEEMVSSLGIPITSGGGISDYLITVSKGLIQFVCVNYRQNSYRSMTAEKISIHPGSVMFKECPKYLIAGEIVKTTKTFARSVSPLKREWLDKINPNLFKKLTQSNSAKGERDRYPLTKRENEESSQNPKRRSNNNSMILIAGHEIQLKPYKGKKKIAIIHWNLAKQMASEVQFQDLFQYNKIRGTIRYQGKDLFADHKLPNLLLAAKTIDPDQDLINVSLSGNWNAAEKPKEIISRLDWILKLIPYRKKGLATITLFTDGGQNFWFAPSPSFLQTVDTSLNSMEFLIEILYPLADNDDKEKMNKIYRRLSQISEERRSIS